MYISVDTLRYISISQHVDHGNILGNYMLYYILLYVDTTYGQK